MATLMHQGAIMSMPNLQMHSGNKGKDMSLMPLWMRQHMSSFPLNKWEVDPSMTVGDLEEI